MHKFLWTWIDQGVPWNDGNQSSASNWKTLIYEQIPPIEMAYFPFTSIFIKILFFDQNRNKKQSISNPASRALFASFSAQSEQNLETPAIHCKSFSHRCNFGRKQDCVTLAKTTFTIATGSGQAATWKTREAGRLVGRWLPLTNSWKQAGSTNLFSCVPSLSTFEWVLGGFKEDFLRMVSNLWVKPTLKQHVSETVNYKTKREAVILDLCVLVLHNFGRYGKWWPSDAFA